MAMALNAFYGIQVTLTDTTAHNLLALLIAIDPTLSGILQNVATLQVQADPANGGANIMIGDSSISTTRYGVKLVAGSAQYIYRDGMAVPLGATYVLASVATPLYLNVMIVIM